MNTKEMYNSLPDLYPGRCKNHRSVSYPGCQNEVLRCLGYEGTEHVCNFPKHSGYNVSSSSSWLYESAEPKKRKTLGQLFRR